MRHDGDDNYLFDLEGCDVCSMLKIKEIRTEAATLRRISPFPATESTLETVWSQLGIRCIGQDGHSLESKLSFRI